MAITLTSKQRAFLMAQASKEKAVLQIGKDGLTPEVTEAVNKELSGGTAGCSAGSKRAHALRAGADDRTQDRAV